MSNNSQLRWIFMSIVVFTITAIILKSTQRNDAHQSQEEYPVLTASASPFDLPPPPTESEGIPVPSVPAVLPPRPHVNYDGFCNGYETFCSTTTTDKPAETLKKLAAAMALGTDNYRVLVSIVVEPLPEKTEN